MVSPLPPIVAVLWTERLNTRTGMAELPHRSDTNTCATADRGTAPEYEVGPGTPGWVIVFGVVALALAVVVVVVHLAGGGMGGMRNHGMPQR